MERSKIRDRVAKSVPVVINDERNDDAPPPDSRIALRSIRATSFLGTMS